MTESELLAGIQRKDNQAFRYMYENFGPKILGYVMKNSGSRADADEVIQESLLKVWQKVQEGKYESQGKLQNYVIQVGRNTWLETLRNRRRKPTDQLENKEWQLADEGEVDLHQKIEKYKSLDALYVGLSKLGEPCNSLIQLFHFEEIPLKEIAEQQQIEYGSLRKRIFDCRKKLQKLAKGVISNQ